MIIDSSIILAIYFKEKQAEWAAEQLNFYSDNLKMSTVNLTEVLIQLQDRQSEKFSILSEQLLNSPIKFIPPDLEQSKIAASTRLRFPINLGDCFVYALAKVNQDTILTLDSDFKKTDALILFP
jgi:ribonuclease VapC